MPQVSYTFSFKRNTDLVMSPEELKAIYFFDIPIAGQSGQVFSNENLKFYLQAAQQEIEHHLEIKLKKQVFNESNDYGYIQFMKWGYIKTFFPVKDPLKIEGYLGNQKQVEYPPEWLVTKTVDDDHYLNRTVRIVPTSGTVTYSNSLFFGIHRRVGYDSRNVPEYWLLKYITGFNELPIDVVNVIGKLAAINVFSLLGDIILGAGIASKSIGLDGLSQSITTTQSAENAGYSARIKQYLQDIKTGMPRLEAQYKGMQMAVV